MDDATIKNNLEKKRNELGLSQTEMARRLEISLNAYRKLEKGKTRILNEHVEKFAEKTGTSVAELVNGFEPINSAMVGLNDVKESYDKKLRVLEDGYIKEIAMLKTEIERLNDKIKGQRRDHQHEPQAHPPLRKRTWTKGRRIASVPAPWDGTTSGAKVSAHTS